MHLLLSVTHVRLRARFFYNSEISLKMLFDI